MFVGNVSVDSPGRREFSPKSKLPQERSEDSPNRPVAGSLFSEKKLSLNAFPERRGTTRSLKVILLCLFFCCFFKKRLGSTSVQTNNVQHFWPPESSSCRPALVLNTKKGKPGRAEHPDALQKPKSFHLFYQTIVRINAERQRRDANGTKSGEFLL